MTQEHDYQHIVYKYYNESDVLVDNEKSCYFADNKSHPLDDIHVGNLDTCTESLDVCLQYDAPVAIH